ncbi:SH3 domain-containing protein [Oceanobacillus rekensis]|uniref:SH3 domain-containing protein n=1 Tax=Oceanobacillus rekensis TaxID=937927 RepID=UPI000B433161|nr:SH3 domain-containing protein [Oceanobacillus rekensis]
MAMKIEQFFRDTQLEIDHMKKDLQANLQPNVTEELLLFAKHQTGLMMDSVWQNIGWRYNQLQDLDAYFPENPSAEQQQEYRKNFFRLTDPGSISNDLKKALKLDDFELEYWHFINTMEQKEYGAIFKRYEYPEDFFAAIKKGIFNHIEALVGALQRYAEALGKHALILKEMKASQGEKAIIKGSATALGLLVGLPFVGAGVGALLGGNDRSKIADSLGTISKDWNTYEQQLHQFLNRLEEHLELAILAVYGGTILRVNEQLKTLNLQIQNLAMDDYGYILELTPDERLNIYEWVREATAGIQSLIKQGRFQEAIQVANKFHAAVKKHPVVGRDRIEGKLSTLYIAHQHTFMAYEEALLTEYRNGHMDSFYQMAKQLLGELYLLVNNKHLYTVQEELLFRFLKEALKRKQHEDIKLTTEYTKRVEERMEKYQLYAGELTERSTPEELALQFNDDYKGYIAIEQFMEEVLGMDVGESEGDNPILTRKQWKQLIEIDASIGQVDAFTVFLRKKLWKYAGRKFNKHKRKIAATAAAIMIGVTGLQYGDDVYSYGSNKLASVEWTAWIGGSEEQAQAKEVFQINTDYGNIRKDASLDAQIVTVVSRDMDLVSLLEIRTDGEGREWYLVEAPDGVQGWISSGIVE